MPGQQDSSTPSNPNLQAQDPAARVLVIDDDHQVRGVIRRVLEQAGFRVVEANEGAQGLDQYRRSPTDIVITDMLLPVASGLRFIQELFSEFPTAKVIAITGESGGPDYLQLATLYGARHTIKKPFGPNDLLNAVRDILRDEA